MSSSTASSQQATTTSTTASPATKARGLVPVIGPTIESISHEFLVGWKRRREDYESQMKTRVAASGEDYDAVTRSLKDSVEPQLLDTLCELHWSGVDRKNVTNKIVQDEVDKVLGSVKNNVLPDIDQLFREELKMDLGESDVPARVLDYFKRSSEIIAEHGLGKVIGNNATERCRLLIDSLEPQALREEVKKTIRYQQPQEATKVQVLYAIVKQHALVQDQQFNQRKRAKTSSTTRPPAALKTQMAKQPYEKPRQLSHDAQPKDSAKGSKNPKSKAKIPPPSPRPMCKQNHWMSDCPNMTEDEKVAYKKKMREERSKRNHTTAQGKQLSECLPDSDRMITINGVMTLPYCADSGSDATVMTRSHWNALQKVDPTARAEPIQPPLVFRGYGGIEPTAMEKVMIRIQIHTAAGQVEPISPFQCLIVDAEDNEFIVGKDTLHTIGIDVNRQHEQLVSEPADEHHDPFHGDDDGLDPPKSGSDPTQMDIDVHAAVEGMIQRALDQGFPTGKVDKLRLVVYAYDIWRLELGNDLPARVEPLMIRLKADASPYQCKPHKNPPQIREFLQDFNENLVQLGFVVRDQESR